MAIHYTDHEGWDGGIIRNEDLSFTYLTKFQPEWQPYTDNIYGDILYSNNLTEEEAKAKFHSWFPDLPWVP